MSRASQSIVLALLLAAVVVGFAFAQGASADGASHRIVYLYVSGQGPQAKAWYSGGPPSGVPFQDALDTFAKEGFKYAAIVSSGTPSDTTPVVGSSSDRRFFADYVVLLER